MGCDIVVYGAGGMGQEVADLVLAASARGAGWRLRGFVDDDPALRGQEILGVPVLGGREWLAEPAARTSVVTVAVGAPATRRRVCEAVLSAGASQAPALVHPAGYVGLGCELGEGTVVAAGAALTADVRAGRFVIVNAGATVNHNARLGDFATIAPGAHLAGNVCVGEGADVGIGASCVQGRSIGAWSRVGAGAVVVDDVAADTTVVGVPARVVATRSRGWQERFP
ncbi:MAG: NeuD/PglB/VioB family sugar acetyltransferase [Acidimicrobiales bacterium]